MDRLPVVRRSRSFGTSLLVVAGSGRALRTALAAFGVISALVVATAWLALAGRATAAGDVCATGAPASGLYGVTVCITAPAAGSTLSGATTVSGTVTTTGTSPGIQRMVFYLDEGYLLTDYQATPSVTPATYHFTLRTTRFADGAHTIGAEVLARDGWVSPRATASLTISNGQGAPPPNTRTFTPTPGTEPAAGQPLVVATVGDGAGGEANESSVVNLIAGWNPNLFLYLGDVYQKGSATEFDNWYGPAGATDLYGRFRAITDPAIGNHEYENGAAPGYFDYWDNVPHYYSFDAGGWHFISLDSNSQYGGLDPGTPQYEWLAQDLTSHPAKCTIAFFHHPLFDVGAEGASPKVAPLWALLADGGVDIVLNGHDHTYQRWTALDAQGNPDPNGTTEFVAGVGGHALQDIVATDPRALVAARQYGALRLDLRADGATYSFQSPTAGIIDAGVIPCTGVDPPPPPSGSTPASGSGGAPTVAPSAPPAGGAASPGAGTGSAAPAPQGPALRARLLAHRVSTRARTRLAIRFSSTGAAPAAVALFRGSHRLERVSGRAWPGRNAFTLRAPLRAGSYRLVLTVRPGAGAAAVDRGVLRVRAAQGR
jgi:calcineurin-like phosphoesterase family protein/Big-like domain-containing protein